MFSANITFLGLLANKILCDINICSLQTDKLSNLLPIFIDVKEYLSYASKSRPKSSNAKLITPINVNIESNLLECIGIKKTSTMLCKGIT